MLKSSNKKAQAVLSALMETNDDFKGGINSIVLKIDNFIYDENESRPTHQLTKDINSATEYAVRAITIGGGDSGFDPNTELETAFNKAQLENPNIDFTGGLKEVDLKDFNNAIKDMIKDKINQMSLKGDEYKIAAEELNQALNDTTKWSLDKNLDKLLDRFQHSSLGLLQANDKSWTQATINAQQNTLVQAQPYEIQSPKLKRVEQNVSKKIDLSLEYDELLKQKIDKIDEVNKDLDQSVQDAQSKLNMAEQEVENVSKIHQGNLDEIQRNSKTISKNEQKLDKMGFFKKIFSQEAKELRQEIKEAKTNIKEVNKILPTSKKDIENAQSFKGECENARNVAESKQDKNKELKANYENMLESSEKIRENSEKMLVLLPQIDSLNEDIKNLTAEILQKQKELRLLPSKSQERIDMEEEISKIMDEKSGKLKDVTELEDSYDNLNEEVVGGNESIEQAKKNIDNIYKTSKDMSSALKSSGVMVETGKNVLEKAKNIFVKAFELTVVLGVGIDVGGLFNNPQKAKQEMEQSKQTRSLDKQIEKSRKQQSGLDVSIN